MLLFEEIKRNFPATINIEKNSRDMIKEALQYKALEIMSRYSHPLIFIGGTCLRFFQGIKRFSEDLDFDIQYGVNYEKKDHERMLEQFCKEFRKEGYDIDFSCNITFT